jgi:hypothetical protein
MALTMRTGSACRIEMESEEKRRELPSRSLDDPAEAG